MNAEGAAVPERASFADQAFEVSAEAYATTEGSWELSIQAAIAALFDFLAGRPAQTRDCMAASSVGGPEALAHRDRTIDRFSELLRPGFAETATPPPPVVAEAIGGGIYEIIRSHALEHRLDELPEAAPSATVVALAPFVGAPS